jgi:hypothetical protein
MCPVSRTIDHRVERTVVGSPYSRTQLPRVRTLRKSLSTVVPMMVVT